MATRVLADIANYLATVPLQRKQQQYENELANRRLALQEDEAARKAEADKLALEKAQFEQQQRNEGQQQLRDYYQAAEIQPAINELKQGKEPTKNIAPYSMDYLLAQPEATPLALTDKYKLSQYSEYNTGVKGTLDKLRADEESRIKGEQFSSKLAQKESELDLREKMFGEKMDLQEKLAEARRISLEASNALKEDKKKKEAENKSLIQIDKALRNDYLVKQRSEQLQYAANTLALLHSDNPVANQAAKTQLARLSGEVGVLTDRDVERFGGSKALLSKLNQAIAETTTGKLSKENKAFLVDVANSFYKSAQNSLNDRLDVIAGGQSEAFNVPIDRIKPLVAAYSYKPYSKDGDKKTDQISETITTIKSDEEYNKLPSGSVFVGPDGKKRTKP